jgi:hypothetical protein
MMKIFRKLTDEEWKNAQQKAQEYDENEKKHVHGQEAPLTIEQLEAIAQHEKTHPPIPKK